MNELFFRNNEINHSHQLVDQKENKNKITYN